VDSPGDHPRHRRPESHYSASGPYGDSISRYRKTLNQLAQELGRQPTPEEVAEAMAVAPEKIQQIIQAAQRTISLETPIGSEDETSLGDLIADEVPKLPTKPPVRVC